MTNTQRSFISIFHHAHGTSISILDGDTDPVAYWVREDGHDPRNFAEEIERFELPPVYAKAPELLAACQLLIALEYADVHPSDTRWETARQRMRAVVEAITAGQA